MDNELVQEIMGRLDSVGEAISQGAVAGFDVLLRQQVIDGVMSTVLGVVFLVLFAVTAVFLHRSYDYNLTYTDVEGSRYGNKTRRLDGETWGVTRALPGGIVLLVSFVGGLAELIAGIKRLLNPSYYAIKEVLSVFGG